MTNALKFKPILHLKNRKYEALDFNITEGEVKSLSHIFKTMSELDELFLSNNNLTDKNLAVLLDALRQNPNCNKLQKIAVS